jgi:DNA-directed RNA polymerase subunit alpha
MARLYEPSRARVQALPPLFPASVAAPAGALELTPDPRAGYPSALADGALDAPDRPSLVPHPLFGPTMTTSPSALDAPTDAQAPEADFDLRTAPIPNFTTLAQARTEVFRTRRSLESFARDVESMGTEGDEGRRRGLGLWMVGRYADAVQALAQYEQNDVVASFTLGGALMSLGRCSDAAPIFERLTNQYPTEPKPRGLWMEAQVEIALEKGEAEDVAAKIMADLEAAPSEFASSAEFHYLRGRALELRHEFEAALDDYAAAREIDPAHRTNLSRLAHLAERCGLDDLALEAYRALARQLPIDKSVLFNLGILLEDLGRDQEAAACYDIIVRNDPTNQRARIYLEDARSAIDMYYDEDLERKEDRLNQILRTPITDFELSVRARNCLNKMNILVLGDLVKLTEPELLSYKNFGETSLNEIKEILGSKGLRLGMKHEEAVASVEAAARPRAAAAAAAAAAGAPSGGDSSSMLERPLAQLDLSIRVRRALENLSCMTLGDVVQHAEDELLSMPNFGQTSLQELKRKLGDFGLKLNETNK